MLFIIALSLKARRQKVATVTGADLRGVDRLATPYMTGLPK